MNRRKRWQKVLDAEMKREFDSEQHQVEIEVLEDTPVYLHVSISVDDGTLPASIRPTTGTFIRHKSER
ncbi:MAG: hypothetical protein DMG17_31250 [Acidobacteria bacterium]|nr:MAG: hypothetical protein DMG17_31250 [Acidobacteriota bacterium]